MNIRMFGASLSLGVAVVTSPSFSEEEKLEDTLVIGRAQQFYLERESKIGTKLEMDILDIPQSTEIITAQLIKDQAARDITELYRSIAGVSEFSYSGVTFRGFRDDGNVFYDGVRGDPYSGFAVPQLFNVERVEILKGPAGALYGNGQPGGMINYVTKKPSFTKKNELNLTAGSFSTKGVSVDSVGGLNSNVAYRIGAFYESADSFRNNADSKNVEIAGGLLFEFSNRTRLDATFDWIDQDLGGNRLRGVPADDEGNFLVDPSYNANEKFDFQDMEALVLQSTLDHQFSKNFTSSLTLRYLKNDRKQKYHESRSWVNVNDDGKPNIEDQTIRREYRDQDRANEEISITADFVYSFETGSIGHQFLFGGDWHDVNTDYEYYLARFEAEGVGNLNIFHLNYGETDPSTYKLKNMEVAGTKANRRSLYFQELMSLTKRWSVLAGFRYDQFKDQSKKDNSEFDDSALVPRLGLVYKIQDTSSLYLNYSESFLPTALGSQETVREDGIMLDPETGEQIELGWKAEWLNGALMSSFAVYEIVKKDLALSNPNANGPEILNIGEVKSQGFESTLVGDLSEVWTITANYAYNDTVVVEGSAIRNTFGDGKRFANAPEHQLGLWTRYDLPGISSAVAFGADYVSEQVSLSEQKVKPFTVFDMSWTTEIADTHFQLNISNLFDKEYAVSGFSERNGHFPGSPREIILQVSREF